MKPDDLAKELQSVFEQADQLQEASKGISTGFHNIPHVTVSILYINTVCYSVCCILKVSYVLMF